MDKAEETEIINSVEALTTKALVEGIPYQTPVTSILHK